MDGKTHLFVGAATGITIAYVRNKMGYELDGIDIGLITGCAIGSLLPDIDIDTSMLGRFIPGWLLWEHRSVTHSLFFIGVVGLLGLLLKVPYSLNLGVILGITTHLLLDVITPMGLPYLLFPFSYDRIKPYRKRP